MLSLIPSEVIAFLSYDNPCSMNENIHRPDNLYILEFLKNIISSFRLNSKPVVKSQDWCSNNVVEK